MRIKLKYFGIPMPFLSREVRFIELPSSLTIEQLLNFIDDKIDGKAEDLLKSAIYLVNKVKAVKQTVLRDGDEVIIMYTIAGG